jgi:hypothetical protein
MSHKQYLRQMAKMGKKGVKAKNQLIDFIGLSKRCFCQKRLKIQIGEGIDKRPPMLDSGQVRSDSGHEASAGLAPAQA